MFKLVCFSVINVSRSFIWIMLIICVRKEKMFLNFVKFLIKVLIDVLLVSQVVFWLIKIKTVNKIPKVFPDVRCIKVKQFVPSVG